MFTTATKDSAANDLKNDVKSAARNIKDEAKNTAYDAYDDLSSAANRTGRKVRTLIDSAGGEISNATEGLTTQIKGAPVQSSLLALAAGFFLGVLLRR